MDKKPQEHISLDSEKVIGWLGKASWNMAIYSYQSSNLTVMYQANMIWTNDTHLQ